MEHIYETDRLWLRVLDKSAADLLLAYQLRNKAFLEEWEAEKNESFYSLEHQMDMLENEQLSMENGTAFRVYLFKKEEPDKVIGSIAFTNIVGGVFLSCYLGYKLDKDEINKGYMTEALKKAIEIIFGEFGLHRIEGNVMPKNKASLRVLEKLGFYNEGLAYKYLKINGKWEDHIHMVLRNKALEI